MDVVSSTALAKQKKVKLSSLLIVLLSLIILALVFFGWSYLHKINPVNNLIPFSISAESPPKYVFSVGIDRLDKPMAVVSDDKGQIYVADAGHKEIKVYDPNGTYLFSFGKGQLKAPFQMTYNSGEFWVADPEQKKVQVFGSDGVLKQTFVQSPQNKNPNSKEDLIPVAVAVSDAEVYVADTAAQQIKVYDKQGKELRSFGHPGNDKSGLSYPNALWLADSKVFVSDTNNARIQIYSTKGEYLQTIDAKSSKTGPLAFPRGITVMPKGQILVVDVFSHMVRAFDPKGNELWTIGQLGVANSEFDFPNGIWLDKTGRLYVTDRENNRVQVFKF